jgi:type VI secretion system secreted protein VgrG
MTSSYPANVSWFTLSIAGNNFPVFSFAGQEEVSKLFEFRIEFVSSSSNEDLTELINKEACLTIKELDGGERHIHGLAVHLSQLHTANSVTHYVCTLCPRLWYLQKRTDHRIFQNLSVPDIIAHVLSSYGFSAGMYSFKLFYEYKPREYCVQYGESDFHFISRLAQEEGLFYYFSHSEMAHILCFSDWEGGPKIDADPKIRFFPGSGQRADFPTIHKLVLKSQVVSNVASYRDWNPKQPKLKLDSRETLVGDPDTPGPKGMFLEQYRYPHIFQLQAEGNRYAKIQLLRQKSLQKQIFADSNIARYTPGHTFIIFEHERDDVNSCWWIHRVIHEGEQPQILKHEAPDGRGFAYKSMVSAIPETTRFVPVLDHPKIPVFGKQNAVVTGPGDEEIYTDEMGRVKVQFIWDRRDRWNENSSCWLRVSQKWAGVEYGSMAIPRIGHEVIVTFEEGDPDRPLITGSVYNKINKVPYPLPEHKTRSVLKSMSTPGEMDKPRGFNEIYFEDMAGKEDIHIHAEKNMDLLILNDTKEFIGNDLHERVDNNTYKKIEGETHEIMHKPRKTELFADDNLTIEGEVNIAVTGKMLGKTDSEIHLKSGQTMILEAEIELTVMGGGSYVKLDPAGIHFQGPMVDLGAGGSAGGATAADPKLPVTPGKFEKSFTFLDEKGKPLAQKRYRLVSESGVFIEGVTDDAGQTKRLVLQQAEKVQAFYYPFL